MAKLVAFYSRADENYFGGQHRYIKVGNTEKAAKMITQITGADLLQIQQKVPYSADYDTCVAEARKDFQENARPELVNLPTDLNAYDEIYLGYPNYCGTMPMAVYTFLESYDFSGKTIHPFCTHEGSGTNGHIAIGCNNVDRAIYHLSQRGVKFDLDSKNVKNGKTIACYFADEIGGFAFHLVQA